MNNNNNNDNDDSNIIQTALLENYISNLVFHTPILTRNIDSLWSFISDIREVEPNSDSDYLQAIENSLQENTKIKHVLTEKGKQMLKTITFDNTKHKIKTCPIVQTYFKENEKITLLPCKHIFKTNGILHWLEKEKAECPVCRFKLPSKENLS